MHALTNSQFVSRRKENSIATNVDAGTVPLSHSVAAFKLMPVNGGLDRESGRLPAFRPFSRSNEHTFTQY